MSFITRDYVTLFDMPFISWQLMRTVQVRISIHHTFLLYLFHEKANNTSYFRLDYFTYSSSFYLSYHIPGGLLLTIH